MSKRVKILLSLLFVGVALVVGILLSFFVFNREQGIASPFTNPKKEEPKELPLLKYTLSNLKDFPFEIGEIKIEEKIVDYGNYSSYLFSYLGTGGKMSGQINLPHKISNEQNVIILIRGYVAPEIYKTGIGTKSAAAVFAQNGYVTLAPDFLGFGQSDPEPTNSWETRFIKPVNVIELLRLTQKTNFEQINCQLETALECPSASQPYNQIGFWAHSNGGQIALAVLEGLGEVIPTTLWAPVTAPFPYSVLFFSDELADEGKISRKWIAQFEEDYDVFDFSVSRNLDRLRGLVQLHHGTADEAALWSWSSEFVEKVEVENKRRIEELEFLEESLLEATLSSQVKLDLESQKEKLNNLGEIEMEFLSYPGADHNLRPNWNQVIAKDLEFFAENLK
jgi:pimeloyl-ACP methyl ester carboxylesterase